MNKNQQIKMPSSDGKIKVKVKIESFSEIHRMPFTRPLRPTLKITNFSDQLIKCYLNKWTTKSERHSFALVLASNFIKDEDKKKLRRLLGEACNKTPNKQMFDEFTKELSKLDSFREQREMQPRQAPFGEHYYIFRYADFKQRHPGILPPTYYMDYGNKYLQAFKKLNSSDLSAEGLKWRDNTLVSLQKLMEKKRDQFPKEFAKMELNEEEFLKFAYDTHPEAYLTSGLLSLPGQDLLRIVAQPETKHLISPDGINQIFEIIKKTKPEDYQRILEKTGEKSYQDFKKMNQKLFKIPIIQN